MLSISSAKSPVDIEISDDLLQKMQETLDEIESSLRLDAALDHLQERLESILDSLESSELAEAALSVADETLAGIGNALIPAVVFINSPNDSELELITKIDSFFRNILSNKLGIDPQEVPLLYSREIKITHPKYLRLFDGRLFGLFGEELASKLREIIFKEMVHREDIPKSVDIVNIETARFLSKKDFSIEVKDGNTNFELKIDKDFDNKNELKELSSDIENLKEIEEYYMYSDVSLEQSYRF